MDRYRRRGIDSLMILHRHCILMLRCQTKIPRGIKKILDCSIILEMHRRTRRQRKMIYRPRCSSSSSQSKFPEFLRPAIMAVAGADLMLMTASIITRAHHGVFPPFVLATEVCDALRDPILRFPLRCWCRQCLWYVFYCR